MIKEESHQFSLGLMCRLLSVSVSGYYDWRSRKPSRREEENRQLANKIKAIFDDEKSRAGSLRITKRLNKDGSTSPLLWIYVHAESSDGLCVNE